MCVIYYISICAAACGRTKAASDALTDTAAAVPVAVVAPAFDAGAAEAGCVLMIPEISIPVICFMSGFVSCCIVPDLGSAGFCTATDGFQPSLQSLQKAARRSF